MMTILELYAWALGKGVTNYEILIQHRDGSGDCLGKDDELRIVIDENVAIDRDEATVTL